METKIEACACRGRGCNACEQTGMREARATAEAPEHTVEHADCSGMGCAYCGMRGYFTADITIEEGAKNTMTPRTRAGLEWMERVYRTEMRPGFLEIGKALHIADYVPFLAGKARQVGLAVELTKAQPRFTVSGMKGTATLEQMLAANAEDEFVTEWLRAAKVGDVFDEGHSERVERVS